MLEDVFDKCQQLGQAIDRMIAPTVDAAVSWRRPGPRAGGGTVRDVTDGDGAGTRQPALPGASSGSHATRPDRRQVP
jgi:hypothetical protein